MISGFFVGVFAALLAVVTARQFGAGPVRPFIPLNMSHLVTLDDLADASLILPGERTDLTGGSE